MDKIMVLRGSEFRDRWIGWCVNLSDYENINFDDDDYDQQIFDLFENHSFSFDENIHEYYEF